MGRKGEPPQDAQAPGFFVQYAALWCLMLAFFICMLSLGHERTAEFKTGVGFIRDAFGLKGGLGMLPFWHMIAGESSHKGQTSRAPQVEEEGNLIGYFKGMLWKEGLASVSILRVEVDEWKVGVVMKVPLSFPEGESVLDTTAKEFLDRIAGVFFNLPDWFLSVGCLTPAADDENGSLRLASERASVVARYLQDVGRIEGNRVEAVGYAHSRYTGIEAPDAGGVVMFTLRKVKKPAEADESIEGG
jgi:flagellar motor protein MotB